MSNPEQHPDETICAAPTEPPRAYRVELLEPRDVPLGGLRAMNVRRTLPQRSRSLIGAWCFLDHYGPDDVTVTGGMNVPAHPHIGLQTVSWLFSGEIEHRDSAGHHALVRPGELNLMTAGRGISHSERSTPRSTVLHGAQLWVALPSGSRDGAKGFEHYAPPVLRGENGVWSAQVFLGALLGDTSPVETHTPLLGAEIRIEPGAELEIAVRSDFEHGVLIDSGAASLAIRETGGDDFEAEEAIAKDHLAFAPLGAEALRLTADRDEGARLLLLGGVPLGEQIVMWWNFIGRDHDEIARARADWQAELAGVGVPDVSAARAPGETGSAGAAEASESRPDTVDAESDVDPERFGLPHDEPEPPLAAPRLPIARLLPRQQ